MLLFLVVTAGASPALHSAERKAKDTGFILTKKLPSGESLRGDPANAVLAQL